MLRCGNFDPPPYTLLDTLHESEHWWSDFFTLACGALYRCDDAAKAWIHQSIALPYEELGHVPA
eukprot:12698935-Alexandrium_andersonii.AAC.1